ncbi:MAG: GrpB family protein [Candidatus Natronoplasma sp.]
MSHHHIHMFEERSQRYEDHLLFRNYLINNRDTAEEYGKLKLQLWRDHKNDRKKYTDKKSDFIERTLKEAKKET